MNDKIKELQREIERERSLINNCDHEFGVVFFDPETISVGYGSVQDGAGSDPHWGYEGYRDELKNRWTKKCIKCGFEKHTYKKKPIINDYEPDFD